MYGRNLNESQTSSDKNRLPFETWSDRDICSWFETLNLAYDYSECIVAARLTGRLLIQVDANYLRDELSVSHDPDKVAILAGLANLKKNEFVAPQSSFSINRQTQGITPLSIDASKSNSSMPTNLPGISPSNLQQSSDIHAEMKQDFVEVAALPGSLPPAHPTSVGPQNVLAPDHQNLQSFQVTSATGLNQAVDPSGGQVVYQSPPALVQPMIGPDGQQMWDPNMYVGPQENGAIQFADPNMVQQFDMTQDQSVGQYPPGTAISSYSVSYDPKRFARFKDEQLHLLEQIHLENPRPSKQRMEELALLLQCSLKKIEMWFSNRRSKEKRTTQFSKRVQSFESGEISEESRNPPRKVPRMSCPGCGRRCHVASATCPNCCYEFPKRIKMPSKVEDPTHKVPMMKCPACTFPNHVACSRCTNCCHPFPKAMRRLDQLEEEEAQRDIEIGDGPLPDMQPVDASAVQANVISALTIPPANGASSSTAPVEPVIPPPPEAISSESAATINPQVMFDPTQVDHTTIPPLNQNGQSVDQSGQQPLLVPGGQQVNQMGQQLFQSGQEIDPTGQMIFQGGQPIDNQMGFQGGQQVLEAMHVDDVMGVQLPPPPPGQEEYVQPDNGQGVYCGVYNTQGGCQTPCPFIHECSRCSRPGHNQYQCPRVRLSTLDRPRPFECSVCKKRFPKPSILKRHMRVHTGEKPFICVHCQKPFAHNQDRKRHEMSHTGERPFRCHLCNKGFIPRNNLTKHIQHHAQGRLPARALPPAPDPIPGFPMARPTMAVSHPRKIGPKNFSCRYCDKRFDRNQNLIHHERIHTGEKPYECHICNRKFTQEYHVQRHLKTHDKNKEKFYCDVLGCIRVFSWPKDLKEHKKYDHGNFVFACSECDAKFRRPSAVKRHMKRHTDRAREFGEDLVEPHMIIQHAPAYQYQQTIMEDGQIIYTGDGMDIQTDELGNPISMSPMDGEIQGMVPMSQMDQFTTDQYGNPIGVYSADQMHSYQMAQMQQDELNMPDDQQIGEGMPQNQMHMQQNGQVLADGQMLPNGQLQYDNSFPPNMQPGGQIDGQFSQSIAQTDSIGGHLSQPMQLGSDLSHSMEGHLDGQLSQNLTQSDVGGLLSQSIAQPDSVNGQLPQSVYHTGQLGGQLQPSETDTMAGHLPPSMQHTGQISNGHVLQETFNELRNQPSLVELPVLRPLEDSQVVQNLMKGDQNSQPALQPLVSPESGKVSSEQVAKVEPIQPNATGENLVVNDQTASVPATIISETTKVR
eukprot:176805_1